MHVSVVIGANTLAAIRVFMCLLHWINKFLNLPIIFASQSSIPDRILNCAFPSFRLCVAFHFVNRLVLYLIHLSQRSFSLRFDHNNAVFVLFLRLSLSLSLVSLLFSFDSIPFILFDIIFYYGHIKIKIKLQ